MDTNSWLTTKNIVILIIIILVIVCCIRSMAPSINVMQPPNIVYNPPMVENVYTEGFGNGEMDYVPQMDNEWPQIMPDRGWISDGAGREEGEMDGGKTLENIPANYYFLDDGAGGEMDITNNLCSKSCCSEQWVNPAKMKYDPYVCANKSKFIPSNSFCSNSFQDAGCLCLTKKQGRFLYSRGGNGGSEYF